MLHHKAAVCFANATCRRDHERHRGVARLRGVVANPLALGAYAVKKMQPTMKRFGAEGRRRGHITSGCAQSKNIVEGHPSVTGHKGRNCGDGAAAVAVIDRCDRGGYKGTTRTQTAAARRHTPDPPGTPKRVLIDET
jgi:hypothetical protein